MSEIQAAEPEVYKIGWGRRVALIFVFTLMLPFFFSMPVMTVMRAAHGNFADAAVIAIAAVIFAICLYYLALQIRAAQRTRIEIADNATRVVAPHWRGMFPTGPYIEKEIPYTDVQSVEERGELFRLMGVVGIPKVSSIVTNDGQRIVLGASNEGEADPAIDYSAVAAKIAQKANQTIQDKGVIDAGTQIGVLFTGSPSWEKDPISEGRIAVIRRRGQTARKGLIAACFALAAVGSALMLVPGVKTQIKDLMSKTQTEASPTQ